MSMPKIECSHIDKCCAASSLLQSIALEEAAISHILNAEGEKLQKAISLPECSHDDLLEINKSVEDMVDKITTLEIVLKSKLDLINPILEHCDKPMKHSCYFCVKTKFDHLSNKYDKNPHIFKRCGGKILFKIKLLKGTRLF